MSPTIPNAKPGSVHAQASTQYLRACEAFKSALLTARELLGLDITREKWDAPSMLPMMTVGDIASHMLLVIRGLRSRFGEDLNQYAQLPLANVTYETLRVESEPDLFTRPHEYVRGGATHVALFGVDELLPRFDDHVEYLNRELPSFSPSTRVRGADDQSAFELAHYLETRVVELTVHTDDLAATLNVSASFDGDALAVATERLLQMVRAKSDDLTILRALTRPTRQSIDILRLL